MPAHPSRSPHAACALLWAGLNCRDSNCRAGDAGLGTPAEGGGVLRPTLPPTPGPLAPPSRARMAHSASPPAQAGARHERPSSPLATVPAPQRRPGARRAGRRRRADRQHHRGARRRAAHARAARSALVTRAQVLSRGAGHWRREGPTSALAGAAHARMRARTRLRSARARPASIPPAPDAVPPGARAAACAKTAAAAGGALRSRCARTRRWRLRRRMSAARRGQRFARGPHTSGESIRRRSGLRSGH